MANWINEQTRGAIKEVLEGIMEAEVEVLVWGKPYERQDYRNVRRKRKLQIRVGETELEVPRLRVLQFQPGVIDRYHRVQISIEEAMIEMYLSGVSPGRSPTSPRRCATPPSRPLIAVGVNSNKYREILGIVEGGSEGADSWNAF